MVNFVDDSTAFYGSRNPEEIPKKLDEVYSRVENWMAANKLVINGSKTHLLVAVQARQQGEIRTHSAGAFKGHSSLVLGSFMSRAQRYYSAVPNEEKLGTTNSVKKKLDKWVRQNIPIR